jgi:hypothetical protein
MAGARSIDSSLVTLDISSESPITTSYTTDKSSNHLFTATTTTETNTSTTANASTSTIDTTDANNSDSSNTTTVISDDTASASDTDIDSTYALITDPVGTGGGVNLSCDDIEDYAMIEPAGAEESQADLSSLHDELLQEKETQSERFTTAVSLFLLRLARWCLHGLLMLASTLQRRGQCNARMPGKVPPSPTASLAGLDRKQGR